MCDEVGSKLTVRQ